MRTSISSVLCARLAACALMIAVLLPAMVDAAGLGRMTVLSALGQPLNAEIELNATKDELSTMQVRTASADAYRRANLEYSAFVTSVRLAIEQRRDGSMIVRATTPRAVNDPFIELLVELLWSSGRLTREYTALIDPPGFTAGDTVAPPVAAAATAKPAVVDPEPVAAPLASAAPAPASAAKVAPKTKAVAEAAPVAPKASAPAKSEASGAAAGAGEHGPVRRGDTLGRIAESVRPPGVSLDQMLVSLYRENKGAFDGNNMNRLRTGAVLRVPDAASIGSVGAVDATREVRAQAVDFNAYRQRVAGAVQEAPAVAASGGSAAAGRIEPRVAEKAPGPAPGSDVLRVSKGDASKGAGDPKAAQASREEDATAREKALREANERVAALEKLLKDSQRLLDIQSRQLAELQPKGTVDPSKAAQPQKGPEAPKGAEPAKAAPAPAPTDAKPEPVAPEVKPEPSPPVPAAEAVAAPKPVEAVKPKPVPVPPPPPAPSFVNQAIAFGTHYMTEIGLGLVALLGIGGLVARRRKSRAPAMPASAAAAEPSINTPASPAETLDEPVVATQAEVEEVDPLAEAEVYLSYGRDSQAEEILRDAIAKTPMRHDLHLKLLGIYMKRGDVTAFESVARPLHASTGGTGTTWQDAAAMGASIDRDNPLYGGKRSDSGRDRNNSTIPGGAASAAAAAAAAVAATAVSARPIDVEKTQVLTVEDTRPAQPPEALDFAFEMPAPAAQDDVVDVGVSADGKPAITETDMGFTLDFGSAETASVPERLDLPLDLLPESTAAAPADLAFDPVTPAPAGSQTPSLPEPLFHAEATNVLLDSGPATGSIRDFKLAAARAEAAATSMPADGAPPPTQPLLGQETMIMASPGELVTFDMTHPAGLPQNWQETTLPRVNLDLSDTMIDSRGSAGGDDHWNDVNTKYDLAKAYEEMGDKEGAREILREVIAEGDDQQKADAQLMLSRLG